MRIFIEYVKKKKFYFGKKTIKKKQKEEILRGFTKGKNIDEFCLIEFNCNKLTINKKLKKIFGR